MLLGDPRGATSHPAARTQTICTYFSGTALLSHAIGGRNLLLNRFRWLDFTRLEYVVGEVDTATSLSATIVTVGE